jgi:UDP-galactopyranose mutase
MTTAPILVFSHLRWDFVFQRPQQLLSRLAAHRPVIFVEEPIRSLNNPPHWKRSTREPNITVYQPHTPVDAPPSFDDHQLHHIAPLIPQLLEQENLRPDRHILWLYTPMAIPLIRDLQPAAVVYDCMDELSSFLNAPASMLAREQELLSLADVVFTGGPSLYRAKQSRHPNCHCFPSSVDAAHFAAAVDPSIDAPDQSEIPRPRIGFFGVIDERLDIPLLHHLAHARPDWHICMVGPVVKINPESLPHAPNIHYFGQRDYADLPRFLAGWDVAMLPFARNEATRYISPTKTLEYMAADKPIVSTPITDVAEPYGDIVHLGDTPDQFVAAIERALSARPSERQTRSQAMRQVLHQTSWSRTAAQMAAQIDRAVRARASGLQLGASRSADDHAPAVIIGAGPTGLSAAYHLGPDALLLEKNDRVGGWCRSVYDRGFTFDMAGHIMFSNDPYVHEMYRMLLGDNVHWQDREAWIYSKGVHTRYPFQGCLHGLPEDVIVECIVGAIEARFGPLDETVLDDHVARAAAGLTCSRTTSNGNGSSNGASTSGSTTSNGNGNGSTSSHGSSNGDRDIHANGNGSATGNGDTMNGDVKDCCADGILESEVALSDAADLPASAQQHPPANFESFIYRTWGRGIARHFAIPYNRKLWAVDLKEMETSWLGGRVPMPNIQQMIRNALSPADKPMGPNARFGYPLRGGFQALMNGFIPHIHQQLRCNTDVVAVSPLRRTLTTADGRTIPFRVLISTMPLPRLIQIMGSEAPAFVQRAAKLLRHVSVRCVNLGIARENITNMHWIYYPEDTVFHRIFVQGNASPHCNPPGGFGLTCEITYSPAKPLPCDGDDLVQLCLRDCRRVGLLRDDDELWTANQVDMPCAYVVYDHERKHSVDLIRRWLNQHDILLAGRYSEWEYYNSDHAFTAGKNIAEQARRRLHSHAPAAQATATSSNP